MPSRVTKERLRLQLLGVVLLALLVYAQTLLYPFVWDDFPFIVDNPALQTVDVGGYFTDKATLSSNSDYHHAIYRPLRTTLYALLYSAVGADPLPFHLLSVLMHAACCVMLFLLARRLGLNEWAAGIGAALFAVHPVHVEAVTWVSSLSDPLSTLFYLGALWCFLDKQPNRRWGTVFLLLPLALFAKEMAITLPLVLGGWVFLRADGMQGKRAKEAWKAVVVGLAVALIYFIWRKAVLGEVSQDPMTQSGLFKALLKAPLVVGQYVSMLVWPVPLNAFRPAVHLHRWLEWDYLLPTVAAAGLIWGTFAVGKKHPQVRLLGVWFFVSLLPILNLLPVWVDVAERFVYLPSAAFCLAIGYGVARLKKHRTVLAVALTAVLALTAMVRNTLWASDMVIANDNVVKTPDNPSGYWNLGITGLRYAEWRAAAGAFERYAQMDPQPRFDLQLNLTAAYVGMQDWPKAEAAAIRAQQLAYDDTTRAYADYNLKIARKKR